MNTLVYQLNTIPDISLPKYQYLDAGDVDKVLAKQAEFLGVCHTIMRQWEISAHLLYVYDPGLGKRQRLQMYLMFRSESAKALSMLRGLLPDMTISQYYRFEERSADGALNRFTFRSAAALIKREKCLTFIRQQTGVEFPFYSVSEWEMNEESRMVDMLRMLQALGETSGKACAMRLDLYATDASESFSLAARQPLRRIAELQYGTDKIHLSSLSQSKEYLDESIRGIQQSYEKWGDQLDSQPHFQFNFYAMAHEFEQAAIILGAAGAEALTSGSYDILPIRVDTGGCGVGLRIQDGARRYNRVENGVTLCSRAGCEALGAWSTLMVMKEATAFFRFPALYEGETLDIPKESARAVSTDNGLALGTDESGSAVAYPVSLLAKHALIAGVPGSGKTNTMLHMVSELWKKHGIPFLVFEPAKKEYRAIFNDPEIDGVHLFSPGVASRFPLKANPLAFPKGVTLSEHISMLMEDFAGAFYLQESAGAYLDRAVEKAYAKYGWKIDTINDGLLPYPVLKDVYDLLKQELKNTMMSAELKGNFEAFLEVRIGGMMRRDAGELYLCEQCTIQPDDWLNTPAIIELETLDSETRNFFILLVLTWIRETLRCRPNADKDKHPHVRHMIFIEEAHNLIASTTEQSGTEQVNPKISATAFIVKMLAEVRALREGIVIADQLPSLLSPEVIKNTSLKVLHRMAAQDDRELMGSTMNASGAQLAEVSTYGTGQTLVFYEGLQRPFRMQIAQWSFKGASGDARYVPMEAQALARRTSRSPTAPRKPSALSAEVEAMKRAYAKTAASVEDYENARRGANGASSKDADSLRTRACGEYIAFHRQLMGSTLKNSRPGLYEQLEASMAHWRKVLGLPSGK